MPLWKYILGGVLTGISLWPLIWGIQDMQRSAEDARIRDIIQQEYPCAKP